MRLAIVIASGYENSQLASLPTAPLDGELVARRLSEPDTGALVVKQLLGDRELPERLALLLAGQGTILESVIIYFCGYLAWMGNRSPALLLDAPRARAFPVSRLCRLLERCTTDALVIFDTLAVVDETKSPFAVADAVDGVAAGFGLSLTTIVRGDPGTPDDPHSSSPFTRLLVKAFNRAATKRGSAELTARDLYAMMGRNRRYVDIFQSSRYRPGLRQFVLLPAETAGFDFHPQYGAAPEETTTPSAATDQVLPEPSPGVAAAPVEASPAEPDTPGISDTPPSLEDEGPLFSEAPPPKEGLDERHPRYFEDVDEVTAVQKFDGALPPEPGADELQDATEAEEDTATRPVDPENIDEIGALLAGEPTMLSEGTSGAHAFDAEAAGQQPEAEYPAGDAAPAESAAYLRAQPVMPVGQTPIVRLGEEEPAGTPVSGVVPAAAETTVESFVQAPSDVSVSQAPDLSEPAEPEDAAFEAAFQALTTPPPEAPEFEAAGSSLAELAAKITSETPPAGPEAEAASAPLAELTERLSSETPPAPTDTDFGSGSLADLAPQLEPDVPGEAESADEEPAGLADKLEPEPETPRPGQVQETPIHAEEELPSAAAEAPEQAEEPAEAAPEEAAEEAEEPAPAEAVEEEPPVAAEEVAEEEEAQEPAPEEAAEGAEEPAPTEAVEEEPPIAAAEAAEETEEPAEAAPEEAAEEAEEPAPAEAVEVEPPIAAAEAAEKAEEPAEAAPEETTEEPEAAPPAEIVGAIETTAPEPEATPEQDDLVVGEDDVEVEPETPRAPPVAAVAAAEAEPTLISESPLQTETAEELSTEAAGAAVGATAEAAAVPESETPPTGEGELVVDEDDVEIEPEPETPRAAPVEEPAPSAEAPEADAAAPLAEQLAGRTPTIEAEQPEEPPPPVDEEETAAPESMYAAAEAALAAEPTSDADAGDESTVGETHPDPSAPTADAEVRTLDEAFSAVPPPPALDQPTPDAFGGEVIADESAGAGPAMGAEPAAPPVAPLGRQAYRPMAPTLVDDSMTLAAVQPPGEWRPVAPETEATAPVEPIESAPTERVPSIPGELAGDGRSVTVETSSEEEAAHDTPVAPPPALEEATDELAPPQPFEEPAAPWSDSAPYAPTEAAPGAAMAAAVAAADATVGALSNGLASSSEGEESEWDNAPPEPPDAEAIEGDAGPPTVQSPTPPPAEPAMGPALEPMPTVAVAPTAVEYSPTSDLAVGMDAALDAAMEAVAAFDAEAQSGDVAPSPTEGAVPDTEGVPPPETPAALVSGGEPPPMTVEGALALGDELREAGALIAAMEEYKRTLLLLGAERTHERAQVYVRLGEVLRKLGRNAEALSNYQKALRIEPLHEKAVSEAIDLLCTAGEYHSVDELLSAQLAGLQEEAAQVDVLRAKVDLWLDRAQDPSRGEAALRDLIAADPQDTGAVRRLVELLHSGGKHREAVEARVALSDHFLSSPARRARVLVEAARAATEHLDDPDYAVELANLALTADPSALDALEIASAALVREEAWDRLADIYEAMLEQWEDDRVALDLAKKLGFLARDNLGDPERASRAFELALALDDSDTELRFALADLYDQQEDLNQAIFHCRAAVQGDPTNVRGYHRAYQLFTKAGDSDTAWNASIVLDHLDEADINESLVAESFRPDGLLQAIDFITDEDWAQGLFSPERDSTIATILEAVSRGAVEFRIEQLRKEKKLPNLNPEMREDLDRSTTTLARTMLWAGRLLGIQVPGLYIYPQVKGGLSAAAVAEPSALASRTLGSGLTANQLAFLWGRHLTFFRPEHYLLVFYPTIKDLAALMVATLAIGEGSDMSGDSRKARQRASGLKKKLRDDELDRLRRATRKFSSENATGQMLAWARTVELSAGRAGLLACGDLNVAAALVREYPVGGQLTPEARIADLMSYSISKEYAQLREKLGVTVKG